MAGRPPRLGPGLGVGLGGAASPFALQSLVSATAAAAAAAPLLAPPQEEGGPPLLPASVVYKMSCERFSWPQLEPQVRQPVCCETCGVPQCASQVECNTVPLLDWRALNSSATLSEMQQQYMCGSCCPD